MKCKFCFLMFAICALIFGKIVAQEENCLPPVSTKSESFNYLKLGAGASKNAIGPSIGLGRRIAMEGSAIDISVNWSANYFSLPKMLYLGYLTPSSPSSFYYGAGMSFGTIGSKGHRFSGLLAEAAIGYEMQRDTDVKLFTQLDFSHGMIPFRSKNSHHGFSPAIAFTFGAGF